MLETYGWEGVVFNAPHATLIASERFSWNVLNFTEAPGAFFGFVLDGENACLRHLGTSYPLRSGTYFAINTGDVTLTNPGGRIMVVYQRGADFPFQIGRIERRGRLRYIDGCTDSLLVAPWRKGEACLNLLHIPAGVEQTMHTHPSDRIGVVVSGRGQCITPDGVTELTKGVLWRIPADGLHRFRTDTDELTVVAWHPDSDVGMTDELHPMLSKTIVDGVSATDLPEIRTR